MKRITMSLDPRSIDRAIKELGKYKRELSQKAHLLVQKLVEFGVEFAKNEVISLGAFDTGELAASIDGLMYTDGARGIIFTNCGHAAYVEFGTGVVGERSPHPTLPWQYDINSHEDEGWVYFDQKRGEFRWTKGMPSRPYMYHTARALEAEVVRIAREVWQ